MKIKNPVLRGFNPDPSLLRVGQDYYIATSTFEWFPGISIYHSRDLVNWDLISHGLTNEKELDLKGIDSACGIWAPNLTHCNGVFYLMYTIVYTNRSRFKDTHNFIITSEKITGPWSKPVFVNSSGFDPSLFHDDCGKKYVVNMVVDYRTNKNRFAGIDVQEYCKEKQCLIGSPIRIFEGTERGFTEGPNIIKKGKWYYLTCAEGGTEYGHCSIMLRSENIYGPYEMSPLNPIIKSSLDIDSGLQRAGHMQLMEDGDGQWYAAHLCSRPIQGYSILGRETAIQNIEWTEEGWCRLSGNQYGLPEMYFEKKCNYVKAVEGILRYDFTKGDLPVDFYTLRQSCETNRIKIQEGKLVIYGGCSVSSKYNQGLYARRLDTFLCDFKVCVYFEPKHYRHIAGLVIYYNYDNVYQLKISKDKNGKNIALQTIVNKVIEESQPVYIGDEYYRSEIYIKAEIREKKVCFYCSTDDQIYIQVGEQQKMCYISDEHVEGNGFTGAMVGVNCIDLQGDGCLAKFDWLEYKRL